MTNEGMESPAESEKSPGTAIGVCVVVVATWTESLASLLNAILSDPGADLEVVLVEARDPAAASDDYRPSERLLSDGRLRRYSGVGLSHPEQRALGASAASAPLVAHLDLSDLGAERVTGIEAALLARPAMELLLAARCAAAWVNACTLGRRSP